MRVFVITGPTASGKSDTAMKFASISGVNGVVINADSIQVYSQIPIISASPTQYDKKNVEHAVYNFVSNSDLLLNGRFSVAKWLYEVGLAIQSAFNNGKTPIVVGGSGMYIRSLLYGISDIPSITKECEMEAVLHYNNVGHDEFLRGVQSIDPQTPSDKHRLIRNYLFLKNFGDTFKNIASNATKKNEFNYQFCNFVLMPPRDVVYASCNSRFCDMVRDGVFDEVEGVLNKEGESLFDSIKKATAFREIEMHLSGQITKEDVIELSTKSTRHYAKRQCTWFNNQFNNSHFTFCSSKEELFIKLKSFIL
jgi:tRNA dimethylallyltransferase